MNSAERKVIQAVGRLYKTNPPVRQFTMKKFKVGENKYQYRAAGYVWYRETWMDDMLNAYRVLLEFRQKRQRQRNKKPSTEK